MTDARLDHTDCGQCLIDRATHSITIHYARPITVADTDRVLAGQKVHLADQPEEQA